VVAEVLGAAPPEPEVEVLAGVEDGVPELDEFEPHAATPIAARAATASAVASR
jgi:hypothetical protein